MYKKNHLGWLKHFDFILLDLFTMQLSLVISYLIFHVTKDLAAHTVWGMVATVIMLCQLLVTIFFESFKNVLKRGYWREFVALVQHTIEVLALAVLFLYVLHVAREISRAFISVAFICYFVLAYAGRILLKLILRKRSENNHGSRSTFIVTDSRLAPEILSECEKPEFQDIRVVGIILTDLNTTPNEYHGIPCYPLNQDTVSTISHEWVDEIFVYLPDNRQLPENVDDELTSMGMTVHYCIPVRSTNADQHVEHFGTYTVLTSTTKMISANQAFLKRLLDIIGGLVGCLFVLIFTIIIGPIIFIKDPGPIFFKQKRIGKNGKVFGIYKFRSMYKDAEERKKELMDQNKMDGLMFKVDNDPRIIKGIGNFIRNTSIDEFPQFINVLKGDMSLVGTRPPTLDEWEQYETKYRIRMSIKPGITGLWQTSGRSEITDFDEVVKLDAQYIRDWNIGLDLKLILKTIVVVFKREGSQ